MKNNQKTAKLGEDLACQYLIRKKYQILGRNIKYREGEIDIIAQKDKQLIFIEVKTRTNFRFGYGEQSFDLRKRQKLEKAILKYIYQHNYQGAWRVDLITIEINNKKAWLRHYLSQELGHEY
ncbi:YraN family protein [Patescibacteria group bacterium]|nr:YraN family protein [Patescibacteria group bacterium]